MYNLIISGQPDAWDGISTLPCWCGDVPETVRRNMEVWIECVTGALEEQEFLSLLGDTGFESASIEPMRIYRGEDAAAFLAGSGLDVDMIARDINGQVHGCVRARPNRRRRQGVS